jgi:hypothetical protein
LPFAAVFPLHVVVPEVLIVPEENVVPPPVIEVAPRRFKVPPLIAPPVKIELPVTVVQKPALNAPPDTDRLAIEDGSVRFSWPPVNSSSPSSCKLEIVTVFVRNVVVTSPITTALVVPGVVGDQLLETSQ